MINDGQKMKLKNMVKGEVLFDEPLSKHSTIKTGGPAAAFVVPEDIAALSSVLKYAKDERVEIFIVGAGSNVLFGDGGFNGIVVSTVRFRNLDVREKGEAGVALTAESGVFINELVNLSVEEGVEGFEALAGIPGTVGGALLMNAGTHGGTVSDPLLEVRAVDKAGHTYSWPKAKIEFSYRKARFPKSCIILSADFFLKRGSGDEIRKKVDELKERRKTRHPLSWPSLGSIFKNPAKGLSAGELIEEAGLKGVRVGGARIANEHGNWIVNEGGASSKDILVLIHLAKEKVKETSDVSLETEIVIVGEK